MRFERTPAAHSLIWGQLTAKQVGLPRWWQLANATAFGSSASNVVVVLVATMSLRQANSDATLLGLYPCVAGLRTDWAGTTLGILVTIEHRVRSSESALCSSAR
jgi:hypothetical protein